MSHHATQTLQQLGYRLTPQRTLVWDVLRASDGHMDAEQISEQVRGQFPNVNISTVYRTLELLVDLRLVREIHLGPNRRFFEIEEDVPHHHLVCDRCGRVQHVHDEDLAGLTPALQGSQRFIAREVTVFGTCDRCAEGTALATGSDPAHAAGSERTPDGGDHAHP